MLNLINKVTALEKKLENIVQYGVIKEVDTANSLVIADLGNNLTSPKLPYLVNNSGNASVYFVPKIGDQVIVISPSGNIEHGFIIPSIYKGTVAGTEDEWRLKFKHGEITYKAGELKIITDSKLYIETKEAELKAKNAKVDAESIVLAGEDGGGVVCQNHICSFTGGPHPEASSKIKGAI